MKYPDPNLDPFLRLPDPEGPKTYRSYGSGTLLVKITKTALARLENAVLIPHMFLEGVDILE
jgi:hypothetical protein